MKNFGTLLVVIALCAMPMLPELVSSQNSSEANRSEKTHHALPSPPGAQFVPNEVLVQFKSTASKKERLAVKGPIEAQLIERIETEPRRRAVQMVTAGDQCAAMCGRRLAGRDQRNLYLRALTTTSEIRRKILS